METWPFGKAMPSNIHALVAVILFKFIHLAKLFISPAALLCMNQYSNVTAQYCPIIFLSMKFSVKQHKEPGEYTLTHAVTLYFVPHIRPRFHETDCHQHHFNPFIDLCVNRIHPRMFAAALTSHSSGVYASLTLMSSPMLQALWASQMYSLSFGLTRSQFQSSQFLISEMRSGALSSSLLAGFWSNLLIQRTFNS